MSTLDQDRLKNHVDSIAADIGAGIYSKDHLEVMQEDNPDELNTWYVYDHENNQVLDNEWFETEKEAQDYLEGHQGVEISAYDYLQDALDIEYTVNSKGEYIGARVLVAFGGPNIWINTRTRTVEGYSWGDKVFAQYAGDAIGLDDALEELWNCR